MDYEELAEKKYNAGLYDEAITYFSMAILIDNINEDYYIGRAETYALMQDYEKADADYNQALKIKMTDETFLAKANMNYSRKEYEKAISDCDNGLKINPENIELHTLRKKMQKELTEDTTETIKLDTKSACYFRNMTIKARKVAQKYGIAMEDVAEMLADYDFDDVCQALEEVEAEMANEESS